MNKIPEFFLQLRPTTPLRRINTLEKIHNYFLKNKKNFSSLRSVSELENPGYKTVIIKTRFRKVITSSKKYHAHDADNKFKIGDKVKIVESKPFSLKKKWKVIEN